MIMGWVAVGNLYLNVESDAAILAACRLSRRARLRHNEFIHIETP